MGCIMIYMTTTRSNQYAGKCGACGGQVAANEGILTGSRGAWGVAHVGTCPAIVAAPAVVAVPEVAVGVYVTANATIVRVQKGRNGGRVYGKAWTARGWEYKGRAILADIVRPISADEAAAWGHAHDRCVFCSLGLTDERSVAVGYGPVCAGNYGLPWGVASIQIDPTGRYTLSA